METVYDYVGQVDGLADVSNLLSIKPEQSILLHEWNFNCVMFYCQLNRLD